MLEPLAVLAVHGVQDLADDRVGQVVENIRQVVEVQVADGRDQFLGRHVPDQAGAHLVVDLDQDFAVQLGIDQFPDRQALGQRQGLQQVRDLGARQAIDQLADLRLGSAVQHLGQVFELARGFFFVHEFTHDAENLCWRNAPALARALPSRDPGVAYYKEPGASIA